MTENLQIGDLAVSGNATIGGNLNIQGKSVLKGDVRVEGWLDADNLKTPCKGLFSSEEKLNEAYPHPTEGWFALVGDTVPADIYVVGKENGENKWTKTGKTGGTIVVNIDDISVSIGEIQEALSKLQTETDGLSTSLTAAKKDHDLFTSMLNYLENRMTSTDFMFDIMPLPFNVKSPLMNSVNVFYSEYGRSDAAILFDDTSGHFLAVKNGTYYSSSICLAKYGMHTMRGTRGSTSRIYINTSNGKFYRLDNTGDVDKLVEIG